MRIPGRLTRASTSIGSAIVLALGLGGCGLFGSPIPEGGKSVRQVYEEMDAPGGPAPLAVAPHPEPGAPPRTRPVIFPPRIFAVYVQEHVDPARDFKIGGHWVYIKLRESSWTEEAIDREPVTSLPFEKAEDLAPVRRAFSGKGFSESLIPYKGSADAAPEKEKPDPARPRRDYPDFVRQAEVRR